MSKSRSLSRSTVADGSSHGGGGLRVPGRTTSTSPSRNSTWAAPSWRKWTLGYCPDGGSTSGTSISTGAPVGHGSIQVPALSVIAIVWLVLATCVILTGAQTGRNVGGGYDRGAR